MALGHRLGSRGNTTLARTALASHLRRLLSEARAAQGLGSDTRRRTAKVAGHLAALIPECVEIYDDDSTMPREFFAIRQG